MAEFVSVKTGFGQVVLHHASCPHIRRHMAGRQIELLAPPGAVLCGHCHGEPVVKIIERANGWRKPVGRYTIGHRRLRTPCECPVCEQASGLARVGGTGRWQCERCGWEGQVHSRTWQRVVL